MGRKGAEENRAGRVRSSDSRHANKEQKDYMTHLRARLILCCVMGRLQSLASATQYITLGREFAVGNCFPLHAQIAIKNNKWHPSVSLSVFLYQSLYQSLVYPHHYTVHSSTCHPPISLRVGSSVCFSSSLTSIPINFCVECLFVFIAIHQSLPLPCFYPQDKSSVFPNGCYTFTSLPRSPWKMKLQFSYEGENWRAVKIVTDK